MRKLSPAAPFYNRRRFDELNQLRKYQTIGLWIAKLLNRKLTRKYKSCGRSFAQHRYGCILVLNVLEHVFEPIKVLDNAISLLRHEGKVVTITPCMWPIHSYPIDCQRLLPDWFISYAERRKDVQLLDSVFEFVGYGPISAFANGLEAQLPSPWRTVFGQRYSRLVHKLFNTAGRGQWAASHVAVGAAFAKR